MRDVYVMCVWCVRDVKLRSLKSQVQDLCWARFETKNKGASRNLMFPDRKRPL